ncbi:VOC family protein [Pseudonocardia asaccharolytica]|uniref:Glyoxalase/bleomycin resistance protein n=1 Tax=Pseudonocardia asaccharolytica DSM 44247 = NBRC 16224 TaxID=1123024 RepID=A0A511D4F5_9PSEU|nr:VOC family protein [Pseudonocardia asaccharolytica]GEL19676.1 glyoxalase/bleomycin resistance protein [Pseudonocardia asaccharolytica DSM 44247 = NBRC 16224]
MAIELNHTVVHSHDQDAEARFVADVLGLPGPSRFGPFTVVAVANGVSLDFMTTSEVATQHYAFLISEDEFDAVAARLRDRGAATFADPAHRTPGHNTNDGGRAMYFDSPSGHNLEVLTRPYGSGSG